MIATATVTDNLHVIVTIDGQQVDDCGPWINSESAHQWAAAIVTALENGENPYGDQEN